jgi:hypothetical protein
MPGALWGASTVEYPWPAKAREGKGQLEDFCPDRQHGEGAEGDDVCGGLNIPSACCHTGGGDRAQHSRSFIILRTRKGEGKSDKRTVLLDRIGFQNDHARDQR